MKQINTRFSEFYALHVLFIATIMLAINNADERNCWKWCTRLR